MNAIYKLATASATSQWKQHEEFDILSSLYKVSPSILFLTKYHNDPDYPIDHLHPWIRAILTLPNAHYTLLCAYEELESPVESQFAYPQHPPTIHILYQQIPLGILAVRGQHPENLMLQGSRI
jgi:hypothetical protein